MRGDASPAGMSRPTWGSDGSSLKHFSAGGCSRVASGHFAKQNALRAPLTAWERCTLVHSSLPPPGGTRMPPGEGNWYLLRFGGQGLTSRSPGAGRSPPRESNSPGSRRGNYERRRRCVAMGNRTLMDSTPSGRPSARATPPSKKLTTWKACPAVSIAESMRFHFAW